MNNLSANSDRAGLIRLVAFRVKPDEQNLVADLLREAVETWVKTLPGLLSAHILQSDDGTEVINLARWTTEKDWLAMENNRAVGPAFVLPFRLALETRLRTYRIRALVERTNPEAAR